MARKNRKKDDPPSPPADAAGYVLVRTKERVYWRRKRGTIKKATLNSSFKRNAAITAITSPAAKRIYVKLDQFLHRLATGRFIANVSARLRKALKQTGELDFSFMMDYEIQPWYPLGKLLNRPYTITENKNEFIIRIPIKENTVKRHNKQVSDYYFEAILLWGQPDKSKGLKVDSDTSPLYRFGEEKPECRLTITQPTQKLPWMILLKLSCHEGNNPAHMARNYGMKVVKVGQTKGKL